jgi:hypothetical protein
MLVALALAIAPRSVLGGEFRVTPSLSFSQIHDDNLFATPAAESDDISRLGVGVTVAQRSARLTLKARYAIEAERFRRHTELNRAAARQDAAFGIEWAAAKRLRAALSADYVDTQTPSELAVLTSLEIGRRRARRLSTGALITHRLDPRNTSRIEHRFSRDRVVGGAGNDAHAVILALDRNMGPSDRGSLAYRAQRFAFGPQATLSHILVVGWNREVSASADFALEAGPSWTGGRLGADVTAGLRHELRDGHAAFDYVHSQTTAVGHAGPVTVTGVRASLTHRLAGPVWFGASPGVFRITARDSLESTLYSVTSDVAWRSTRNLTLSATHQFSRQEGGLARAPGPDLAHSTFVLALTRRSYRE